MDSSVRTLIHSATLADAGDLQPDSWVLLAADGVVASGTGDSWNDLVERGTTVIDAQELAGNGALLAPGFIDIHGHGGAGHSFDDGSAAIKAARDMHRMHGTTRAVISLVTADLDTLLQRTASVAACMTERSDILGVHLEGPFLDPGHKGAHEESLLREPIPAAIERLIAETNGVIRQITIAPELPGGLDAIRALVSNDIVAAIGHTNADADVTRDACDAGATVITHAFNAMPGIHHRAPGPVVAAVADPRMYLELIADGIHVDLDLIRMIFASAPGRVVLVTDAMAAAGSGDGDYVLGNLAVTVTDGVARLTHGNSIAGSTLTQDVALRNVVSVGVPVATAIDALTRVAAEAIGVADRYGRVRPGYAADAVLLDRDLNVRAVWADATRV
ncbi:N-acetylglucosamine-6-phosphate deacetylase [Microbacterium sp. NC79]|uniref:N-acetylglucosamine-6-phosphate deacetylase n=1 Tax=Microbacterium sp. NC79 TaxID=2851009 RepID=UPI001C2BF440|nr:N-acetylglucosamine-6-phosphate deacetylase [Microbacterium sp. NC79]